MSAPPITAPTWAPTWAPPWAPVRTGAPTGATFAHGHALRGRSSARRDALNGIATPDGYGRLCLPGEPALEFLLELDRGTEDHGRIKEKARRYGKALPRSELRDPLVLLLLPSSERTTRAAESVAASAAPIVARTWTAESAVSPLALVRDAHAHVDHRRDLEADW